jgi:hypothetical protein
MKGTQRRQQGRAALDLLEEATHLLRTAPVATLAVYYLGAIPFVLGLLFFWADMSRSPFAPQQLAGASFSLAVLFFWMKFCQAIFAGRLRHQAAGEKAFTPGGRQAVRIFVMQAILQPSGLFLVPLAILPLLPFAYVYTFYQNVAALDDGSAGGSAELVKKSWRLAKLWPGQNILALVISAAFAFCLFLNCAVVCLLLPQLAKMLLGIESDFTKSPQAMLNTTFFAAMFGLTYLCADPLMRAIYVLRCFYGESLQSGADLKAELKPFLPSAVKLPALLLILFACGCGVPAAAETAAPPASAKASPGPQTAGLERALDQTIHENKYLWRMPRDSVSEPDAEEGIVAKFFDKAWAMIRGWLRTLRDWIQEWMRKLFPSPQPALSHPSNGYGWILSLQILLYGLAAAVLVALAILLYQICWRRTRPAVVQASKPVQPVPDLTDENVRADQLPEDAWTKLARELLERGECRLAMRAFYLASLAHLAGRNLISIAGFKSNRDYERELRRRAHSLPELLNLFGDNISQFERTWYGTHEASGELVRQFADRVEQLKAGT